MSSASLKRKGGKPETSAATKKHHTDDRLSILEKYKDFANLTAEQVLNVSGDLQPKHYDCLEATSAFVTIVPSLAKFQYRLGAIRIEYLDDLAAWLRDNEADRKFYKLNPSGLAKTARTMGDIREATKAADNKAACYVASSYEAYAISQLLHIGTTTRTVIPDHLPDAEERFKQVVETLEPLHAELEASTAGTSQVVGDSNSSQPSTEQAKAMRPLFSDAAQNPPLEPALETTDSQSSKATTLSMANLQSGSYLYERVKQYQIDLAEYDDIPWSEVFGIDKLKDELEDNAFIVQSAHQLHHSADHKLRCRGTLLYGPNGTGKTTIVRAFAKHFELPLFAIDGSIRSNLQGDTEKLIKLIFQKVLQSQPCVLFFDEADGLLREPGSADSSWGSSVALIKDKLSELAGKRQRVLVFAATNKPWNIPKEDFNRRFGNRQLVGLPDRDTRVKIFKSALPKQIKFNDQQISWLADASKGYTGDDIVGAMGLAERKKLKELREAKAWTTELVGGSRVLVPAPYKDGADVVTYKDLSVEDQQRVHLRPFAFAAIKALFEVDSAERLSKTVDEETLQRYLQWEASIK